MNETTEKSTSTAVTEKKSIPECKEKSESCPLSDLSIAADYDIALKLFDRSGNRTSECAHHFKGSSKHDLINLVAIGGLLLAGAAALLYLVHTVCFITCLKR